MMKPVLGVVLIVACASPALARRQRIIDHSKQELWVRNYKDLGLVVSVSKNALLTEDAVRTKVELRLRQAGIRPVDLLHTQPSPGVLETLFSAGQGQTLYINVTLVRQAFSINLDFQRDVSWTLPDGTVNDSVTTTWTSSGTTGLHGSSSGYVMDALNEQLDEFLNAYLKANQ
jgi:hypothetical protein